MVSKTTVRFCVLGKEATMQDLQIGQTVFPVSVALDHETRRKADQLAREQGTSRSRLIRDLIHAAAMNSQRNVDRGGERLKR
jgi:hypothetical protein